MQITVEEVARLLTEGVHDSEHHVVRRNSRAFSERTEPEASLFSLPMSDDVELIKQAVNLLPDTREQRVRELKALIDNDAYQITGEEIADLMLRRSLADNASI